LATTTTQEYKRIIHADMHQVAWLVLASAFVVFCLSCAAISFGTHYFLYRSTTPMNTVVQVTRGSVGLVRTDLSESFEFEARALSRGDRIITDSQSQAVLSFRAGIAPDNLVASVTVKNNSEVFVRNSVEPRFERSHLGYSVALQATDGELDIFVPDTLARDVAFSVFLADDVVIDVSDSGRYTLAIDDGQFILSTWQGQAAILPPERSASRPVVDGQVGTYDRESREIAVEERYIDLVGNSSFEQTPTGQPVVARVDTPLTETWNCSDRTGGAPHGDYETVFFDGREALRFFRGPGTGTHGETICIQPFGRSGGQVGQRVDEYDYLEIQTTFYIQHHSLDACGEKGSECPLMLRMEYVDQNGDGVRWFHGFYSKLESRADYPLTCASCSQDHKRINDQTWYTYESGNLFTLLPDGTRPASILNIQFYASGHDYDVYVNNLSLLASPPNPTTAVEQIEDS